jgi:transcription initiation factor TFIID subunit 6
MARPSPTTVSGVWKKDSVRVSSSRSSQFLYTAQPHPILVQDVAETIGIANLSEEVAGALAGDVEYRLWELIEVSSSTLPLSLETLVRIDSTCVRNQSNSCVTRVVHV